MSTKNKLTGIAWDTLWMSIRYSVNRKTIACSSLPADIATQYVHRMNAQQKAMICRDIREELETCRGFGQDKMWEDIDAPNWEALADALDPAKHSVIHVDYEGKRESYTCFAHQGKWVVVDEYFKTGKRTQYVNPDYIVNDTLL